MSLNEAEKAGPERLLLAVDFVHREAVVLIARGICIEEDVRSAGPSGSEYGFDGVTDQAGLWVFTTVPVVHEDGFVEYVNAPTRELRRPTPAEWELIQVGNFVGLYSSWTDVVAGPPPEPITLEADDDADTSETTGME